MLNQAIETYHALLDDALADECQAQLDDQLHRRGLFFGERPLCTVLRPRFLTNDQYRFLQGRVAVLLRAFDTIYEAARADAAFRSQFGLTDWEEQLIAHDPGFAEPSPLSRLDAFFVPQRGGLRFTEYNAETPAAAAYTDVLAEVFLGLPIMREFLRHYELRPLPARQNVMHTLLSAYRSWSGRRAAPRIAILDWREVPTYSEFVIMRDYLRSQGLECEIADPRAAEYRDGRLRVDGFVVDLIYKRVLLSELVQRCGLLHPVVQAVLDNAVCMVNPFRCKLLHKKASLAVLSDECNEHLFSPAEMEAIEAHVPWTRTVVERRTRLHGDDVDLIPFIHANREQLVLKPNDEYGGAGIVLGWKCDADAWAQAVGRALEEPFIVQERVPIPTEAYPSMVDGRVQFSERILDTAPFIFRGAYVDGCLTRLSTDSLVNVTAGGGSSLASFVVERR